MHCILKQPLQVDKVLLRNRVLLAPMSGVSDLPFRRLAWQAGAGMVVSEMVASGELRHGRCESLRRISNETIPLSVVQLAGCQAHRMAEAARIAVDSGADMIDINMGCPAKKVVGGYSGAALMREPGLALALVEAVVRAVAVPVTLKMRLGWDETSINAPLLARQAQDAGVKMLTIHGRTRMQFYRGKADWQAIRAVRAKVTIPLVVNGDITSGQDAVQAMQLSGADAVMIGRASYGRPWLPGQMAGGKAPEDVVAYIQAHYEAMLTHYGMEHGIRHARKHLDWYLLSQCAGLYTAQERAAVMTATQPERVREGLSRILARRTPGKGEAA